MMSHFLYKLISPRSTFPQDMTEKETKVMQEHLTYWKDLVDRKIVVEHTVWRLLRLKIEVYHIPQAILREKMIIT
jgi:hypothetical protein